MSHPSSRFPVQSCRPPAGLVWIPVLMMAALLYWTVALGLGGLSLLAVRALSASDDVEEVEVETAPPAGALAPEPTAVEPAPGFGSESARPGEQAPEILVPVRLQESTDPEDVNDNVGAVAPAAIELDVPGPTWSAP
jgi:hypothetical protein